MTQTARPSVLVIGAGMYVSGRGTPGFGTVLPTLVQAQAEGVIGDLAVAATSSGSLRELHSKLAQLNAQFGTRVHVAGYPKDRAKDPVAYQQALREITRPACAIVAVPDHLHAEIASAVIEAGLHVLVVKPFVPTVAEARRLITLARAHGVYGAVEFHKRWDEANLLLKQTLANGRLGELRHISVDYSQRREIQTAFRSWLQRTNSFQYLGVHYVDLIYFLTGARPLRVLATGQPREAMRDGAWRCDAIQATIEWEGPAAGRSFASTIATNWIEPNASGAMSRQLLRVLGTDGRYDSDQTHRGVQLVTEDGVEDLNPYFSQVYRTATGTTAVHGYGPRSIRQFLRDVQQVAAGACQVADLQQRRPSFQEALISTAVIEAVNQSLARGETWVAVGAGQRQGATAGTAPGPGASRRPLTAVRR